MVRFVLNDKVNIVKLTKNLHTHIYIRKLYKIAFVYVTFVRDIANGI